MFEDALRTGQTLLDCGADFRQLTNRLGQQTGGGDVGNQLTSRSIATKVKHQVHQHRHADVNHQLQYRGVDRLSAGHAQAAVHVVGTGLVEPLDFVGLTTKAANHAIALNRLRSHMGHIAHCHLDFFALLAKFLARATHQSRNDRQDRQQYQRHFPVAVKQITQQKHHRQAFADHHLDRIGGGAGDHGYVIGNTGNQVTGIMVVIVAVRQRQQVVEQGATQVVDHTTGNLGQVIVAQK
ncbi:hypothetical protein D3C77_429980 [compost metagenome]